VTRAEEFQALMTKVRAGKATDDEKKRAAELKAAITPDERKAHAVSQGKRV
jgi:hypothetical protein